jgi:hypothetical protein
LVPFWRLKKGLAVRAKPPEATPKKTDIHSKSQEHGRPKGRQYQNKKAPKAYTSGASENQLSA